MKAKFLFCLALMNIQLCAGQKVPSFEEVISLPGVGSPVMSADGRYVAFTATKPDWEENRYDTEIWLSKDGQPAFQVTRTKKGNSSGVEFSPDGKWLAFLADRGDKTQIHVMRTEGGEAWQATNESESINSIQWHPSGSSFLFTKQNEDKGKKEVENRYGAFGADDKEYRLTHLWQVSFDPDFLDPASLPCYEKTDSLKSKAGCLEWPKAKRLTEGSFTVTSFLVSRDGRYVAINHQPNPLINSFLRSDVSLLELANKALKPLITNASTDAAAEWSPDSRELLYVSNLDDSTSNFYKNSKLFAIDINSGKSRQLAADLDEDLGGTFLWRSNGIFFSQWNKTKRPVYKVDPKTGKHSVYLSSPEQIFGLAMSASGERIALNARNGNQLSEIYVSPTAGVTLSAITNINAQIKDWNVAQSEVISWKSRDGATIEGVLHKPKSYDPDKKYPLLVVIHGGPTGIDTPAPVPGYVYPIVQWLDKGCLVLRPNYRGSAGYGEAFRSLNVNNLGVGDAWDVLSGIDYLDSKGVIDKNKMGCMGWSQGGYISAFLTTSSDVFKAVSVGAGISDWATYYVNTDIHPFTRQYLNATPWSDPEIYRKTSPISYINSAKTPTLIQHGENDQRVPIPNAYQLLQGLRDHLVPAELIVYKGFGHGINKPKERLAAMWHNWQWFNKYIWNEEVDLPTGDTSDKK
ncbi:MAG: prolyl oligopeptidase family serine peptidase [Cyclobacteriaceae bacterium]